MNLNLYGHHGQWLMVDCGITFDEPLTESDATKHDIVCADPAFIVRQKEHLKGIVITHAHEDHIGALPRLWQRFKCDIYTTPFTAELLRRKFQRDGRGKIPTIHEIQSGQSAQIGHFRLTWVAMCHSIPECHGVFIETEAGNLFHTADWKFDASLKRHQTLPQGALKSVAQQNLLATICDSTNALKPGFSVSEEEVYSGLKAQIKRASQRVAVACFSTNIARLISLARIAAETGRYFAVLGRSLENTVSAAKLTGHWPDDLAVQDPNVVGYLPPEEVLIAVTGSQGEMLSSLAKLSRDQFRLMDLEEGDLVIFSAIVIPGNERKIQEVLDNLAAKKVMVLQSQGCKPPIHASGHPNEEELKLFYEWLRPQVAIPTHGEAAHMQRNAELAGQCHVPRQLVGQNGDLFELAPNIRLHQGFTKPGRIALS